MLNNIDHQISEFINFISESKHKRALLDKLENLNELKKFLSEYRQNLKIGNPQLKKQCYVP